MIVDGWWMDDVFVTGSGTVCSDAKMENDDPRTQRDATDSDVDSECVVKLHSITVIDISRYRLDYYYFHFINKSHTIRYDTHTPRYVCVRPKT